MKLLRGIINSLPNLILAFILAIVVWISAVSAADPTEERVYPRQLPVEIVGQDPGLVMTEGVTDQVNLTLKTPRSIWNRIIRESIPVRAVADLSGIGTGEHRVPIQIMVGIRPVRIVSYTPSTVRVVLEKLSSKTLPIHLQQSGEVAVGFHADTPKLSQSDALISGPESLVNQVKEIRAVIDIKQASESINRLVTLQVVDENDVEIKGLTISPSTVNVSVNIAQRGGYRNVVVKVVLKGQVSSGYRVTNISVFPPVVTVFSTDPNLINNLPGYVLTAPLDLTDAKDDLDMHLAIDLSQGITLIGDQTVEVQVSIAAIEGSLTLKNIPVNINGVAAGYIASLSPRTVDVILSGPLPLLDNLTKNNVHVFIDLNGETVGVYQRTPRVNIDIPELLVQSLLPESVEVTIIEAPTVTPSPRPSPTSTPTKKP